MGVCFWQSTQPLLQKVALQRISFNIKQLTEKIMKMAQVIRTWIFLVLGLTQGCQLNANTCKILNFLTKHPSFTGKKNFTGSTLEEAKMLKNKSDENKDSSGSNDLKVNSVELEHVGQLPEFMQKKRTLSMRKKTLPKILRMLRKL